MADQDTDLTQKPTEASSTASPKSEDKNNSNEAEKADDKNNTGDMKAPETTPQDDQADGPEPEHTKTEDGRDIKEDTKHSPITCDEDKQVSSSAPPSSDAKNMDQAGDKTSSTASTKSEDKNNSNKTEKADDKIDNTGDMKAPETTPQDDRTDGPEPEHANTQDGRDIKEDTKHSPITCDEDKHVSSSAPPSSDAKNMDQAGDKTSSTASTKSEDKNNSNKTEKADDKNKTCDMKVPETTPQDDQADGPEPEHTKTEDGRDEDREKQMKDVETIGPTTQGPTEHTVSEVTGILAGRKAYLFAITMVAVVAILVQNFLQPETPPQIDDERQIDIFRRQLEKVETRFPSQRAELWQRSRIHLQKHLQIAQPTEPVSIILTAGLGAETTLHCLAQGLASAFSTALNGSVLQIDGARLASHDSDQVKLDIDKKLQEAFGGDKPVALIHRFEELPPGSTLIFYRYCDHENAAFKNTFLLFTVLLGDKETIPPDTPLTAVEEMVDDYLKEKFLSHDLPISFDRMDIDKYGGLWSRISHLILPVASEKRFEREGCEGT
ncbi:torsin-1A-interacting protein 2-like isoform X2 [Anabas testudineus]|uniref:torsin-1A-interacting protein 2-like isoform X2 n=1 Tax=Anabas testudineus TaxID=64144 RepID=UPI000E458F1C|nr:torsin-1A-interacting protein 2-like isoform X2 [Anabas testudineus]